MNFNFFKKKQDVEYKSLGGNLNLSTSSYNNTASVYIDNQGNITDTIFSSSGDQIRKNSSVNNLLSKQSSIISEADITIKEKNEKQDQQTTNKQALQFIDWLNSPNTYPSPSTRNEIIKYIIGENLKCGISGVLFNFKQGITPNTFMNIKLAQNIVLEDNYKQICYRVSVDQLTDRVYKREIEYPNLFVNVSGDEISVLFVSGNYNIKKARYESPFQDIIQYINLQNHLINFSSSFYKNSCFPSQIVQLTYKNLEVGKVLSPTQKLDFLKAVKQVKHQLEQSKSSNNAGKMIVPEHPSLEIEVKPISIPTGVDDTTGYDSWVTTKLLSAVDGGSKSSFEGENEYSNNAIVKLKDLYDGTFRMFNTTVIDKLNIFMKNLFIVMKVSDGKNMYITFNTSKIKIYQEIDKKEVRELVKESVITVNEGRKKLGEISEEYANYDDLPQGSDLIVQFGRKSPDSKEVNQ